MKNNLILLLMAVFIIGISNYSYSAHNVDDAADVIGRLSTNAIPQLIELAAEEDPDVYDRRILAIQKGLGELGASGADVSAAVPSIIRAMGYGSDIVITYGGSRKIYPYKIRIVSAGALAKIGDKRSVKPLAQRAFTDEDVQVQRAAVRALGEMRSKAQDKDVLTALYDMLEKTHDNSLAYEICIALRKIRDKSAFIHLLRVTQGGFLNYVKDAAQQSISIIMTPTE